jgi:hypothetical protein
MNLFLTFHFLYMWTHRPYFHPMWTHKADVVHFVFFCCETDIVHMDKLQNNNYWYRKEK